LFDEALLVGFDKADALNPPEGLVAGGGVGIAPRDGDGGAGARGPADALAALASGLGRHAARVDNQKVGRGVIGRLGQARCTQVHRQCLALGLVDLASERDDAEGREVHGSFFTRSDRPP